MVYDVTVSVAVSDQEDLMDAIAKLREALDEQTEHSPDDFLVNSGGTVTKDEEQPE